jgi:hypothetical protein
MSLKEYKPGTAFTGVVGRTYDQSEPAWPEPNRTKEGAPNVLFIVLDDTDFAQDLYGIPRERVIGSTLAYRYVEGDGGGAIEQRAELDVIDDGLGKPIQIWNIIGRCPIIAAGNSNGNLQMLTFAGGSSLPALRLLVVHDDEEKEFDYIEGAEKILSAAQANSWTSISIKNDWRKVFPV